MTRTKKANTCPMCGNPLTAEEIAHYVKNECEDLLADGEADCSDCRAAEQAAENASLAYAESGGGQEMINDLWAERVYRGQ